MLCRSMNGSLVYVTAYRPNVIQVVGQVARFQEAPKESHIIAIKRIIRYLKGIIEYGLWYPKGTISLFKPLHMQIGQEALMIVRVLVEQHSI